MNSLIIRHIYIYIYIYRQILSYNIIESQNIPFQPYCLRSHKHSILLQHFTPCSLVKTLKKISNTYEIFLGATNTISIKKNVSPKTHENKKMKKKKKKKEKEITLMMFSLTISY